MRYAFSPAGREKLRALAAPGLLVALDFDGTLAPTVRNPHQAAIPPSTRALLERLAESVPLAAITGRPLRDIRARVPPGFTAWAGDHGAEMAPAQGRRENARLRCLARRRVRAWRAGLRRPLANLPGVWVEKKELSLSVHFRESPRRAHARREILRAVAGLRPGPRVLAGKCVVNLLVPELPNKGNAVQTLLQHLHLSHALYVGDDENDEDVFSLADPRICSVRVGRSARSRATLYLKSQREIDHLLRALLRALRNRKLRARAGARYLGRQ